MQRLIFSQGAKRSPAPFQTPVWGRRLQACCWWLSLASSVLCSCFQQSSAAVSPACLPVTAGARLAPGTGTAKEKLPAFGGHSGDLVVEAAHSFPAIHLQHCGAVTAGSCCKHLALSFQHLPIFLPQYLFTDRDSSKGMFLNDALPCTISPLSHAAFLFKALNCYLIQIDANLTPSLSPPPLILH